MHFASGKILLLVMTSRSLCIRLVMAMPVDNTSRQKLPITSFRSAISTSMPIITTAIISTQPTPSEATAFADPTSTAKTSSHNIFGWERSIEIAFFIAMALVCITVPTVIYLFIRRRRLRKASTNNRRASTSTRAPSSEDPDMSATETHSLSRPPTAISWLEMLKGHNKTPSPPHEQEPVIEMPPKTTHSRGRFWKRAGRRKSADVEAEVIELVREVSQKHNQQKPETGDLKDGAQTPVNRNPTPLHNLNIPSGMPEFTTGEKIIDMKSLEEMDAQEAKAQDAAREVNWEKIT